MPIALAELIPSLARRQGVELAPEAIARIEGLDDPLADRQAMDRLATHLGWDAPVPVIGRPRANHFPLLHFSEEGGWGLAEQWDDDDRFRVVTPAGVEVRPWREEDLLLRVAPPDPLRREAGAERSSAIFRRAILRRRGSFAAAALATVTANIIALATSLFSMQVYDRVIPSSGYATLWALSIGVVFALLLDFALRSTRSLLIERDAAKIDTEVSEYFFARSQAVRLDARPPGIGTMAAQLRGLEQVRALMSSGSLFLIADLPFALFFIVVIALLGGKVALVPLASFPIAIGLGLLFARGIREATNRAHISGNRKNGLLVESLDAAETVKANRGSWHMLARWNRLMEEVHRNEDPVKCWQAVAGTIFGSLQQLAYVALVTFGAIAVTRGEITTGALVACSIIAGRVNGPLLAQLPGFIVQWSYARASLKALDHILSLPPDRPLEATSLRPDALPGPLRLEGVRFAYSGARAGIDIPNLEIQPGERIGLIGGIGSGKTTLLRILAGLYQPQAGVMTIGGLDANHVAVDVLRRHIGYLPQDFRLINGTLRDNLLLGLSDPGDNVVLEAARKTGLAQLISSHPLGLDLPIDEGGRGLSGGQRTLTGLTRLALVEPRLWLLDEPTAHLDQGTEAVVLDAIAARMGPASSFVLVTHKLSLLSLVDRVIVLVNGRIGLDGPTSEVLARLKAASTKRRIAKPQPKVRGVAANNG
ncbi:MAG TPA: ATP-binding cassette domain-containing protein [Sphingomonadaceae bacterium]|nr:ATP-binding cassette domain-containing protein [Sphingomonadaceae bacterium]